MLKLAKMKYMLDLVALFKISLFAPLQNLLDI
jgi:hypothetical protein